MLPYGNQQKIKFKVTRASSAQKELAFLRIENQALHHPGTEDIFRVSTASLAVGTYEIKKDGSERYSFLSLANYRFCNYAKQRAVPVAHVLQQSIRIPGTM